MERLVVAAGNLIKDYWRSLVMLIVCGFALMSFWQWLSPTINRKAVLFTSSPAGDSSAFGDRIAAYFKNKSTGLIVRHEIDVRPSNGLLENRRKVDEAAPGKLVLGFAQDGFDPPPNVRTLLPLTKVVMHVIARKPDPKENVKAPETLGALKKASDEPGKKTPRFYLGPDGSGSRQIAEVILTHYRFERRKVDVGPHLSWESAYQQLARGDIDLIFDASDLGSAFIQGLSRRGEFVLVPLDDVDGMVAGQHNLFEAKIPQNTYGFDTGFCPKNVATVSTQRIIICPKSMSNYDAYYLAAGIREALREIAPTIRWEKSPTPTPDLGLIVPVHPGSEDYRLEREPWVQRVLYDHWWGIVTGLFSFLSVMVYRRLLAGPKETPSAPPASGAPAAGPSVFPAPAVGAMLAPAAGPPVLFAAPPPASPAAAVFAAAPPAAFAVPPDPASRSTPPKLRELLADFERVEDDLGKAGHDLTKKQLSSWKAVIGGLRDKLAAARFEFGQTDGETLKDLHGKLGFLETELASIRQRRAKSPVNPHVPS